MLPGKPPSSTNTLILIQTTDTEADKKSKTHIDNSRAMRREML